MLKHGITLENTVRCGICPFCGVEFFNKQPLQTHIDNECMCKNENRNGRKRTCWYVTLQCLSIQEKLQKTSQRRRVNGLHRASRQGDEDLVQSLIDGGADVNSLVEGKWTSENTSVAFSRECTFAKIIKSRIFDISLVRYTHLIPK